MGGGVGDAAIRPSAERSPTAVVSHSVLAFSSITELQYMSGVAHEYIGSCTASCTAGWRVIHCKAATWALPPHAAPLTPFPNNPTDCITAFSAVHPAAVALAGRCRAAERLLRLLLATRVEEEEDEQGEGEGEKGADGDGGTKPGGKGGEAHGEVAAAAAEVGEKAAGSEAKEATASHAGADGGGEAGDEDDEYSLDLEEDEEEKEEEGAGGDGGGAKGGQDPHAEAGSSGGAAAAADGTGQVRCGNCVLFGA